MKNTTRGLRRNTALLLTSAALAALTAACSFDPADNICMSDEYPVATVGYAGSGSCVSDDKQPPRDSVRYPEGRVPQHVDDKWDTYWQTHALDAHGKLITDPNKVRR